MNNKRNQMMTLLLNLKLIGLQVSDYFKTEGVITKEVRKKSKQVGMLKRDYPNRATRI